MRTLASIENPLFSQASMSAAAAASSRPLRLNQRITRRRTRSVSAARSPWVSGRAGRNAGGPSGPCGPGRKTPSVTAAWRWAWRLSPEPKRWRKETAPSRGRVHGGVAWVEQRRRSRARERQRSRLCRTPRQCCRFATLSSHGRSRPPQTPGLQRLRLQKTRSPPQPAGRGRGVAVVVRAPGRARG